jgi:hypothetical protein
LLYETHALMTRRPLRTGRWSGVDERERESERARESKRERESERVRESERDRDREARE